MRHAGALVGICWFLLALLCIYIGELAGAVVMLVCSYGALRFQSTLDSAFDDDDSDWI